jgi:protein-disulfide isomerase
VLALALAASTAGARADPAAKAFTDEQAKAIEGVVRDYLRRNPDVVVEALNEYRERKQAAERRTAEVSLVAARGDLERDAATPVAGNPDGDVTIVEFFDYQCGYCKRVLPTLQSLIQSDGNIRYVLKEYPILGPQSDTAARAALAVWRIEPASYFKFHTALMSARGGLDEARLLDVAAGLGIDRKRLKKAMADPAVDEAIRRNHELGRSLGINGTPAFVVGNRIVPGAVDLDVLRDLVAEARRG